jgi:hypothetical protein
MKVRVTLMTENDKHMPLKTKAEQEAACRVAWELLCMVMMEASQNDRVALESVEVIEN